jgi:hypothetical protein
MPPIHPGEILLEEFLEPCGNQPVKLAKDISVPPRRITEIVQGKRSISTDRRRVSPDISAFQNDSGSIFNRVMILEWKKTSWMCSLAKKVRVLIVKAALSLCSQAAALT